MSPDRAAFAAARASAQEAAAMHRDLAPAAVAAVHALAGFDLLAA